MSLYSSSWLNVIPKFFITLIDALFAGLAMAENLSMPVKYKLSFTVFAASVAKPCPQLERLKRQPHSILSVSGEWVKKPNGRTKIQPILSRDSVTSTRHNPQPSAGLEKA